MSAHMSELMCATLCPLANYIPAPSCNVAGNPDWRERSKQMKRKLLSWASHGTGVGFVLVLMALATEPIKFLLERLLTQSGTKWERLQQAHEAHGRERSYQVKEAALGGNLRLFQADLRHRFHEIPRALPRCWAAVFLRRAGGLLSGHCGFVTRVLLLLTVTTVTI